MHVFLMYLLLLSCHIIYYLIYFPAVDEVSASVFVLEFTSCCQLGLRIYIAKLFLWRESNEFNLCVGGKVIQCIIFDSKFYFPTDDFQFQTNKQYPFASGTELTILKAGAELRLV